MLIKKVEVRAAAALTGSNVTTNAVNVRGARLYAFQCSASNATVLSAATIEISNDGTNWVALNATLGTAPANGKATAVQDGGVISIALNAGSATLFATPLGTNNTLPVFHMDAQARLKVSTAGTVNDFTVTALVYYDENVRIQVGEGFTPAL